MGLNVVDETAKSELREQPKCETSSKGILPSIPLAQHYCERSEPKENNVDRQDVQQGRPVDHECGVDESTRVAGGKVKVEKVMHSRPVAASRDRRFYHESKGQQQQLVEVQLSGSRP